MKASRELISKLRSLERDQDGAFIFDTSRVRAFPKNPRKIFRRIPELAKSIKICGQRQPGKVRILLGENGFDAELIDGERRFRACVLAGVKFRAYPESGITGVGDQMERSFIANFGKEDHDCIEVANGIKDIMDTNNRSIQEVADMASKSITWAYQHLNLLKLHPEVQEMLVPGENADTEPAKISFLTAQSLVKLPPALQVKTANEIVAGNMNQVKARRHVLQVGRSTGKLFVTGRRKMGREFFALMRLSEKLSDSLGIFLDMKDKELTELFATAPESSKMLLKRRLEKFKGELDQLVEVIERKMKKA